MASGSCLLFCPEPLLRLGLRAILSQQAGLKICGEARNEAEVCSLQNAHSPGIIVISAMHGEDPVLIRHLSRHPVAAAILVVAHQINPQNVLRSLRAGARGYITLEDGLDDLLHALKAAQEDGIYLSQHASSTLITRLAQSPGKEVTLTCLSNRELEIFHLIGRAFGSKEIAFQLNISIKTVETHKQRIKEKLGLHTGAELNQHAAAARIRHTLPPAARPRSKSSAIDPAVHPRPSPMPAPASRR